MFTYFDKTLSARYTSDKVSTPEEALKFMRETSGLSWEEGEACARIVKLEVLRTQDGFVIDLRADYMGTFQRYFGRLLSAHQSNFVPLY